MISLNEALAFFKNRRYEITQKETVYLFNDMDSNTGLEVYSEAELIKLADSMILEDSVEWFDYVLEDSDRELLHKELDLKIAYPAHFDDLVAEDQEKVKQAKLKEDLKEQKFCSCGHSGNYHNKEKGCHFRISPEKPKEYFDTLGYCMCTKFVETKSIKCDVCENSFDYELLDIPEGEDRPADELPDGTLYRGKWICMDCCTCSECGTSLEKEGNMEENKEDKLCRDCKGEKS